MKILHNILSWLSEGLTQIRNYIYHFILWLQGGGIAEGVIENGVFKKHEGKKSKVIIPDGVTSIGNLAFWGCTSLTSIVIPEGVTSIGSGAFQGCTGLTSIVIPEGVTSIGNSAFNNCTSLTSIVIPEGVTSIGNSAFWGCTGLTLYFGVSISQLDCNIKQVSSKAVEITKIIQEMDTYKFLESIEKPLGLSIFYSTWGGISKCYHKLKDKERERVLTTLLSLYRLGNIAKLPPLPIEDILPFIFKPVVDNRCDYASIKQTVKPDRQVATVKRCI